MTDERRLRFVGPFDARSGNELEQIAAFVARRGRNGDAPATVHVDLSRVTRLDASAVPCLNRAWAVLSRAGWSMQVEAPEQGSARWPFVDAAIRGEFEWARATTRRVRRFSAG